MFPKHWKRLFNPRGYSLIDSTGMIWMESSERSDVWISPIKQNQQHQLWVRNQDLNSFDYQDSSENNSESHNQVKFWSPDLA